MKNESTQRPAASMEQLSNQYSDMINENNVKKDVLTQKLKSTANKMKDTLTQIQIGDDSRVEEAVIISFFASLFEDMTKTYQLYKEYARERKIQQLGDANDVLQQKLDNINEFREHSARINRYTSLNIEKSALEKHILELKQVHQENKEEGVIEITDKPDELLELEKKLLKVEKEMNVIAKFYGYDSNPDFMSDVEKCEHLNFGEDASEYIKSLRALDSSKVDELERNIHTFPGDEERVHSLKSAFNKIENHFQRGSTDEEAIGLVSDFRSAITAVQSSITVNQLAKQGEELQKADSSTTKGTSSQTELV